MNSKSLLNIINVIIKNDKNFSESPDEIYSLFKKHGYEGDIETLKLDLRNLLDDVIKSDEELSKVAGGKVSKLAAGAVAALTCLPMNSFASGITDAIKSGAKKVGDATNEYVIKPIANNPGKSAAVATTLAVYGLLSGLVGKYLASPPPVVDPQGLNAGEKEVVENTRKVLEELTKNFYVVIEDKEKETKEEEKKEEEKKEEENKKEENKKYSWNLDKLREKPEGQPGKVRIGALVTALMPEKVGSDPASYAYTQQRQTFIDYENAQLKTIEKLDEGKIENLEKLTKENKVLQQQLNEKDVEILQKKEEIEEKTKELENEKNKKEEEIKEKYVEELKQDIEKFEELKTEINKKQEEIEEKTKELEKQKQEFENEKEEKEKEIKQKIEQEIKQKTEELEKEKEEKEKEIKQKIEELEKIEDELNQTNVELEETKQKLEEANNNKNNVIAPQNNEAVEALTKQCEELQNQKNETAEQLKEANKQLEQTREELEKMQKENAEKIQEEVNKQINEHQEQQNQQKQELEQLKQEKQTLQEKLNAFNQQLPEDTNKQLLLFSSPNLDEIYKTIDAKIGGVLQNLRQEVSTNTKAACNTFRRISNTLRGEKKRPTEIVDNNKITGPLSLADILLVREVSEGVKEGSLVYNVKDFEGFNLEIDTRWENIKKLKEDSEKIHSWEAWLAPIKTKILEPNKGLVNNDVVKQLPELILAAATFKNSKTLTSLLTALEKLLILDAKSDYRKNVNKALYNIGMRFDDTIYRLVSTTKTKK